MQENKFATKGFLIWFICASFFFYEFLLRTIIGAYQLPIMRDLHLSSLQYSLVSSTMFLILYGFMQIPVGLITDKLGLKKSLSIGAITCSIACAALAHSNVFSTALVSRMLMGFGASFGFICLLIAVHEWMPKKYIAIFIGLSQFIGTLGPIFAAGPLESLIISTNISWRNTFNYLFIFGLALLILIYFIVENNQQKAGKYIILRRPEKTKNALFRLFLRAQPWYIAITSAALYFLIEYLSENEGRTFLTLKGIPIANASYMITIAWIGYAIGCPLLGFISDMYERRRVIIRFCAIIGLIATTTILYSNSQSKLLLAFLLLGISASGQSIGFANIAEQFTPQFIAVGFGLNNAMITALAAINAPIIGILLDSVKQGYTNTLSEYLKVFDFLIILPLIAIIMSFFFMKETFCKSSV